MKTTISTSIDTDYLEPIKTFCAMNNTNISAFFESLIKNWLIDYKKEKIEAETTLLNCINCHTNYISDLGKCPNCALNDFKQQQTAKIQEIHEHETNQQIEIKQNLIKNQIEKLNQEGKLLIQSKEFSTEEKIQQANLLHMQIKELKKQLEGAINGT